MNILQSLMSFIQYQIFQTSINFQHRLKKMRVSIAINREYPIIAQGALDEIHCHQTPRGKSTVKISELKMKSYQSKYLKDIWSRFNQFRPVVSHLEYFLPQKPITPKNIGSKRSQQRRKIKSYYDLFHCIYYFLQVK